MITSLDPDPESDFQLYGDSRFGSNVKRNYNTDIGVIILAQDPDPESDFQPFGDSGSGSGSSKSGIITPLH